MKTTTEVVNWVDNMLARHPNVEDVNYFNAIKYYVSTWQRPACGANMVADLCSICKHGDNCERSDKGISFANHSVCWKFER